MNFVDAFHICFSLFLCTFIRPFVFRLNCFTFIVFVISGPVIPDYAVYPFLGVVRWPIAAKCVSFSLLLIVVSLATTPTLLYIYIFWLVSSFGTRNRNTFCFSILFTKALACFIRWTNTHKKCNFCSIKGKSAQYQCPFTIVGHMLNEKFILNSLVEIYRYSNELNFVLYYQKWNQ